MSKIITHTLPAEEIACWIAEISHEYPSLPRGEQRTARKQVRQLRQELDIRREFDRIATEQHFFMDVETYAATIEPDGFELPF